MLTSRLLSGFIGRSLNVAIIHAMGVASLFLLNGMLARSLGVENYGKYSSAVALANVSAVLVLAGSPTLLLRYASPYFSSKQYASLVGIVIHTLIVIAFTFLLWLVLASLLSFSNISDIDIAHSFKLAFPLLPIMVISLWLRALLRAIGRLYWSIFPPEILFPFGYIFLIAFSEVSDAKVAVWLYFFAGFFSYLIMGIVASRVLRRTVANVKPQFSTRNWLSGSLSMWGNSLIQVMSRRIDIIIITVYLAFEDVGVYTVALQVALLTSFFMSAVNTVAAPRMSGLFHQKRFVEFKKLLGVATVVSGLGGALVLVPIVLFSEQILMFFGFESTSLHRLVLLVLAIAGVINSISGPIGTALLMSDGQKSLLVVNIGSLAIKIVLNALLLQKFGVIAAACIHLTLTVISNTLLWVIFLQRYRKRINNNGA